MAPEQSRHAHKMRALRGVDDETWRVFSEAAVGMGLNSSAVLREFIRWYIHQADQPPPRPEGR